MHSVHSLHLLDLTHLESLDIGQAKADRHSKDDKSSLHFYYDNVACSCWLVRGLDESDDDASCLLSDIPINNNLSRPF